MWRRHRAGEASARARLIELHLPFVRILAAKLYARRQVREIEFDEYHHYGVVGLLEAMDRYDPGRSVQFRSFAAHRIEGSILNGIQRHNELQEQISLKTRLKKQRLASLKDGLNEADGQTSTFARLAEVAVGMALGYILDDSGMYVSGEREFAESAYASAEAGEIKAIVTELVGQLTEREQHVIKSHYFWGMGVDEIGAMLGVTKGRVSQIHRQALRNLLLEYRRRMRLDVQL